MLWFIIVLSITILGFLLLAICDHFDLWGFESVGCVIGIIGAIVLVIMTCCAICANTDIDAYVASMQQRHDALVYQLENNVYENDNDIGKRELYEQIYEWNEDLAARKECQDSAWVGIFYADVYDQFEFIPLK